jgi:hypothetical protein
VTTDLYAANRPSRFWRLTSDDPAEPVWEEAALAAAAALPAEAQAPSVNELLERTLGEGQFGPGHWRLPGPQRVYYLVKRLLPRPVIKELRRAHSAAALRDFPLGWPVEDRYRQFLWDTLAGVLARGDRAEARFVFFWPGGHTHALVLTHDIETADGQAWAPRLADLEEDLGFRSSFNFVTERYPIDHGLIQELWRRGFEVGVHGLRHDGREFASRRTFERRARRINEHVARVGAAGFRAPLTHRHPEWMQALDVDYDASFFDTDPLEPIPGGTMSIWPFLLGHFVELPYTLAQDYTLTDVLEQRTPSLWLAKAEYVASRFGMVLGNVHPDYLRRPERWGIYREFLRIMRERPGAWNALPRDVATWWRRRTAACTAELLACPDVREATAHLSETGLEVCVGARLASPAGPSGPGPDGG